jgi:hypothetical protein
VLIIDEAQNLSTDVLEQLRLLTNLETNERKLLQIILIGQPELRDMWRGPSSSSSRSAWWRDSTSTRWPRRRPRTTSSTACRWPA